MEFEALYKAYYDKVFRLCMGYANDYDIARDLVQETFIAVWKNLRHFRKESHVGTWIYRIATNNCLKMIEQKQRMQTTGLPSNLMAEKQWDPEPQIRLLYQYIAELAEIDRIVISMELEEVKQSEIAKITGLSESNIRVKIHRIKERLTKRFNENGK